MAHFAYNDWDERLGRPDSIRERKLSQVTILTPNPHCLGSGTTEKVRGGEPEKSMVCTISISQQAGWIVNGEEPRVLVSPSRLVRNSM